MSIPPIRGAARLALLSALLAVPACRAPFEPDTSGGGTQPPPASPPLPFRVGSFGADVPAGVATDAAGRAYIASYFSGSVDFDPGSGATVRVAQGPYDIAVARYASDGTFDWAYSIGGGDADLPAAVGVAPDGGAYVAGYVGAGAVCSGKPVPAIGGRDAFLMRVSNAGTCTWAIAFGGVGDDAVRGVLVDADGSVIVTGTFSGTADFDPGAGTALLVSRGGTDGFIARYSSEGAYLSVAQIGGISDDAGTALAFTAEGDIIAGGEFRGTATFGSSLSPLNLLSVGDADFWVARYSPQLGLQWAIRGGGAGPDAVGTKGLAVQSNLILVSGTFSGVADVDPGASSVLLTSFGATDVFLVRYDLSGAYAGLARSFGGAGSDGADGLVADAIGNLFLAGWFQGTVDFDPSAGTHPVTALGTGGAADGFLLALDAGGALRWVDPLGSVVGGDANFGITTGLALRPGARLWAVGRFYGLLDLDPGPEAVRLQSAGDADIYASVYDAASGAIVR
jgi:hypothetical protein